jgi:anti-sigma regulatory factor (Ser/Thr protein kinase)
MYMAPGRDPSRQPSLARTLVLPAEGTAPGVARAELRAFLAADELPAEQLYELQLLVSEVVGNAVRHGSCEGDAVEVEYERHEDELHVSVTDAGRGISEPAVRAQSIDHTSGRGLHVVQKLSDEWAAELRPGHCAVWFKARLQPPAAAA